MKLTKREHRFLATALGESAKSTYSRVQIGAVLVKGGHIITKAANLSTSHPLQFHYNELVGRLAPMHALHAEMHALVKLRGRKADEIFIARLDRNGQPAMCQPCKACARALRDYGINRVVYTTPTGVKSYESHRKQ